MCILAISSHISRGFKLEAVVLNGVNTRMQQRPLAEVVNVECMSDSYMRIVQGKEKANGESCPMADLYSVYIH